MLNLMPWRKKKAEVAKGADPVPDRDFPFMLSWMRDEFDRLFDRFAFRFPVLEKKEGWRWGVDMEEKEDAYLVKAEAPGFEAADFDVKVEDGHLILSAEKKEEKGKKGDKDYEYREQSCYETVLLPTGIDKDKVEATCKNGVLTVKLPKTAEGKAKEIPIKNA